MACTACLACIISTVNGHSKKIALYEAALVAGTLQTFSNLFFNFDIYGKAMDLETRVFVTTRQHANTAFSNKKGCLLG
jgi:hypothetical protein